MESPQITLQKSLQPGYEAYAQDHALPGYVRRAVQAILACRTARLGGPVQSCPEGHLERIWYHSCQHRMCPPWAGLQIERWLVIQKARLLAGAPYYVIFTMPSERHALWLANVAVMTTLVFASVRDTLLEVLDDENDLGAMPGIIATLHPWSQTLLLHPHLQSLVTGGSLTSPGQWVAVRHGCLLPSRGAMALFRGKLLAAVRRVVCQGPLQRPEGPRPQRCENLLNKLGRQKWHGHIRERYPHGTGVRISLARYLRGGPLANYRLVSCAQGEVTFRYRVNGEAAERPRSELMTWPMAECIRGSRRHVPDPGPRIVRSDALYAPTKRAALVVGRDQLGQGPVTAPVVLDWQTACRQQGAEHPERCPVCGQRLVSRGRVPRPRISPPARAPAAVAA